MDVLTQLLSISNIVLCLAIVALVWMQRKSAEVLVKRFAKKDLKKYPLWEELFIPMSPLVTGSLLALIPQLPIPEMFDGGAGARMVFGLGIGLVSGLVFRIIKKNFFDRLGTANETTTYEK
jgi:hypothetical protein